MTFSIEPTSALYPTEPTPLQPESSGGRPLFGESGPSFADLLDVVNPLQHLPVIGTIYRALTGDAISDGARLAGGALFGGPIGLAAALVDIGVEQATGRNLGDTVLAAVMGDDGPAAAPQAPAATAPTQVAEAAPAAASQPAAPARDLPQLSPAAFDALMRSVNRPESASPAAIARRPDAWSHAAVLNASAPAADALLDGVAEPPLAAAPEARQAGLELYQALRAYAEQRGIAPAR